MTNKVDCCGLLRPENRILGIGQLVVDILTERNKMVT